MIDTIVLPEKLETSLDMLFMHCRLNARHGLHLSQADCRANVPRFEQAIAEELAKPRSEETYMEIRQLESMLAHLRHYRDPATP